MSTHIKIITVLSLVVFASCSSGGGEVKMGSSAGVKKDFSTGLVASYKNIEPEKVYLVMNDEVLNHNDIPIGESFAVINENVKGFEVKEGKISLGCSLVIEDSAGNKLLSEPDFFAQNHLYNEEDASRLRCTVTTGEPMQWEEKYKVTVVFWDKYGDGKIENVVTIRAIDIP